MESEQKIIRAISGPSAIGDIGEKYAYEYLKEDGLTMVALGARLPDNHAGYADEYLRSGKLWNHLTDEQIRFIFRPSYPKSYWKHGLDMDKLNPTQPLPHSPLFNCDDPYEMIRQGRYDEREHVFLDRVSWDFVGWWTNGNKGAFLFEVKTASPGKTPGTFRPERDIWSPTGMEPFELRKLDRVGFIPYLVQVQLTDDDNPNISVNDIPIP